MFPFASLPSTTGIHYRSDVLLIPRNNIVTDTINAPIVSSLPIFVPPMQVSSRRAHEITPEPSPGSVMHDGFQQPIQSTVVTPDATSGVAPVPSSPGVPRHASVGFPPATTGESPGASVSFANCPTIGATSPTPMSLPCISTSLPHGLVALHQLWDLRLPLVHPARHGFLHPVHHLWEWHPDLLCHLQ
jgi:hypothetical protein